MIITANYFIACHIPTNKSSKLARDARAATAEDGDDVLVVKDTLTSGSECEGFTPVNSIFEELAFYCNEVLYEEKCGIILVSRHLTANV